MADRAGAAWRINGWQATLLFTVLASLAAFFIGQRFESRVGDVFLSVLNVWNDPRKDIVVVAIDEDTLAHLPYRSPVDRGFLADLIAHIGKAGATVIGVDILLDQPSEPDKDRRLTEVAASSKTPVIMATATKADGLTDKQVAFLAQSLTGVTTGLATLLRDRSDGTVRRAFAGREINGAWRPGLAAAVARARDPDAAPPTGRITYYSAADGGPYPFTTYPAHTVPLLPADWFAGKTVLIGGTLPTADLHQTPFTTSLGAERGLIHGVYIHAHLVSQMLRGDRLREVSGLMAFVVIFAVCIIAALLFTTGWSPLWRLLAAAGLLIVLWLAGAQLFQQARLQIPLVAPSIGLVLVSTLLTAVQWYRDRAQRDFIEKAFSQYVSPGLVKRIVASEEDLTLGGEKRFVTYVFTDLERFTSLAERLEAQEIAALLNEYLDHMCELFIAAEATIDKLVGDAVIGFFGAPERQDDQRQRAVALALAIDRFSQDYRRRLAARGIDLGVTRVGVHCGEAVVGNFGGTRFFDYTAIGDTVNTAARLEGANRLIGTRICVSKAVADGVTDTRFRPIGTLVLKGKTEGVPCFEPVSGDRADSPSIAAYEAAFAAIAAGDTRARDAVDRVLALAPEDALAAFYRDRLRDGETGTTITLTAK